MIKLSYLRSLDKIHDMVDNPTVDISLPLLSISRADTR